MEVIDTVICVGYLLSVIGMGALFTYYARKQQQKESGGDGLAEYYLGGRKLPWWALAIADVSSYIDIAGTMINTALIYAIGVKGMFIEIRGGLCVFLAFQLTFTGKLVRRCPVRTKGEWIQFRFGDGKDARIARMIVALTTLCGSVMSVTYFAVGGGKFVCEFIDIPNWLGFPSHVWAACFLMLLAIGYTIVSGFTSMVYTDVYQSIFIFISFIIVAILGLRVHLPASFILYEPIRSNTTSEQQFVSWNVTKSDWISISIPSQLHFPGNVSYSMYNSYSNVILVYLLLQTMRSVSGPGGGGLQSVLATKSERDVRSQTFLAMFLLTFRWAFSAGVAVLAIEYSIRNPAISIDPEQVVPLVIAKVLPAGIKGIVLSALLAAALTTFDSGINNASSYWTIDIYQTFINSTASKRQLLFQARLSTICVMFLGLFVSLYVNRINKVWGFMTIALAGGVVWPYSFSWYFARFNATSCSIGIVSGILTAYILFFFLPQESEMLALLLTSSISFILSMVTCFFTTSTSYKTLKTFYKHAKPPGFWNHIAKDCFVPNELSKIKTENYKDLACVVLIVIVQCCFYLLAVSLVLKSYLQVLILSIVISVLSPLIYKYWYRTLNTVIIQPNEAMEPFLASES